MSLLRRLSITVIICHFALGLLLLLFPRTLHGDDYHYKDILIGERAAGLGGAFVAISDDPSGIYHNPAGILFSLENYLSVSANAYSASSQVFENIYPGENYTYSSQAFVPVLFGFIQSNGKDKFGLAVIVPNYDLIDQSDTVTRPSGEGEVQVSFTRKFFRQDITYLIGPAYAKELAENFSIGIAVFGMARLVKLIDNTLILYEPIGTGKYFVYNSFLNRTSLGIMGKVGFQYMPMPKLSLGLTVTLPFNMSGSGTARIISTQSASDNTPVNPTGDFDDDMTQVDYPNVFHDFPVPITFSLGAAYFLSRTLLLSGQLDYNGGHYDYREYPIAVTINWALGAEYFLNDAIAIRGGLFSNNSTSKHIVYGGINQPPKVDMICASLGVSLYRSGTSLTLGGTYATGVGRGQAFTDLTLVQRVKQNAVGIFVAGSYQL